MSLPGHLSVPLGGGEVGVSLAGGRVSGHAG